MSQSLFQQMVFCNILIIILKQSREKVTILILVDGFLQYSGDYINGVNTVSHNPYFSRWFSAILSNPTVKSKFIKSQSLFQQMVFCNNKSYDLLSTKEYCHNPYFSRWFSAIPLKKLHMEEMNKSQSLFQQMVFCNNMYVAVETPLGMGHNPYFSRWFSAIIMNFTVN